jgi:hypothetical protein
MDCDYVTIEKWLQGNKKTSKKLGMAICHKQSISIARENRRGRIMGQSEVK